VTGYDPKRCPPVRLMINKLDELSTELDQLSIQRTSAITEFRSINKRQKVVEKKIRAQRIWEKPVVVTLDRFKNRLSVGDRVHTLTKGKFPERDAKVEVIVLDKIYIRYPIRNSITWRKSTNLFKQS